MAGRANWGRLDAARFRLRSQLLCMATLCVILGAGHAAAQDRRDTEDLVIRVPDLVIVGATTAGPLEIAAPDLVIVGSETSGPLEIAVPDLIIVGSEAAGPLEIDLPDLVIVGSPTAGPLEIAVPDLIIVGSETAGPLEINVPDLVIVGSPTAGPLEIAVPDLVIVGSETAGPLEIAVPDLVIVGSEITGALEITPPDLIIVGVEELATLFITPPDLVIVGTNAVQSDDSLQPTDNEGSLPQTSATNPEPEGTSETEQWCVGAYTAHAGTGVGTALGYSMPVGQTETVPATVRASQCRTALTATLAGQVVTLNLNQAPATYVGSISFGDGVARTMTLECGEDLNLRGTLVAQDSDLRIERPVWLIRDPNSTADLPENCPPSPSR